MTAIHFPLDVQLVAKAPATVIWKRQRPLRLDGRAVGAVPFEDHHLAWTPLSVAVHASQAGIVGLVILEAHVGTDGRVKDVTVLRSQPIFDEAAKTSVLQWRYQPLLLNGVAMEFVLSVTVRFTLRVE